MKKYWVNFVKCLLDRLYKLFLPYLYFFGIYFNPIQDGLFWGLFTNGGGGGFFAPSPKIRHTYPTVMKLGTVIPYLRKIQKMYKSRDISLEFC